MHNDIICAPSFGPRTPSQLKLERGWSNLCLPPKQFVFAPQAICAMELNLKFCLVPGGAGVLQLAGLGLGYVGVAGNG